MHRSTGTVALFNRNMQFHLVNNNNMNSIIEIIRSYGNSTGFKELSKLSYVEPDELTFEEEKIYFDSESGYYYAYNPAAKSTSGSKYRVRKLRMELYNLLSGKTIPLMMVHDPENPDRYDAVVFAGNYLMIPWLSNGTERTVHSQPFDGSAHNINELYSENIQDRKAFLDMEYRLTEIPVNCIEEYLNGDQQYCVNNTVNICIPGVMSEALMIATKQYCGISNGSACTSSNYAPSYVLSAMGLSDSDIECSVRISWGSDTAPKELEENFRFLIETAKQLKG